jgi:flagellar protein FliJ
MKKFFFRLETLLTVRRAHERTIKRDLEHANQKCSEAKEKERMLHTQINSLIEEMHKKRLEGKLDLQETYSQILTHLNSCLAQSKQSLLAQQRQIEEQKQRLKQAVQQRKVIEKIKEKHYAGWRMRAEQSEGVLLDALSHKRPSDIE